MVDLARIDVPTVVATLRGAPQTVGIAADDVQNTYLVIEPADDPTFPPGSLTLSVYVSGEFGSGQVVFAGDGTVKRVNAAS